MHIEVWEGNPTKREHGRSRRIWELGVGWSDLAQGRDKWEVVVNTTMDMWVSQNAGNFLTSRGTVSLSRRTAAWSLSHPSHDSV